MIHWLLKTYSRRLILVFSLITVLSVVFAAIAVRDAALASPALSHVKFYELLASLIFLAFLLSIITGLIMGRSIRGVFLAAAEAVDRISHERFGARLAAESAEEARELAESVNHLAEVFENKIRDLSRSQTQLKGILAGMAEGVVAIGRDGRIIAVNPALKDFFKMNRDVEGKPLIEVLRHNKLQQIVQSIFQDGRSRSDEIVVADDTERILAAHAVPLYDDRQLAGVLIVLHDISRVRQLERVRRDFVANVSHELRTPLTSIKGFAETLQAGAIDDPKNRLDFVAAIEKQADRMIALVEDLLDLTTIESGRRPLSYSSFNLDELIQEVLNGLKSLADRKGVSFEHRAMMDPLIHADRDQLRQVVTNLVDNAIKFNREKGSVSVTGERTGDDVIIAIRDSGLGIPSQDLARIFERFYRVDKARSRELGGTGLGLSIVKHIVEAHGGSIAVNSATGNGSTFTVRLPQNITTHS